MLKTFVLKLGADFVTYLNSCGDDLEAPDKKYMDNHLQSSARKKKKGWGKVVENVKNKENRYLDVSSVTGRAEKLSALFSSGHASVN